MAKVLIAEDEFPIAMDMKVRLQKMGHDVVAIAVHYEDVWTCLSEHKPELVLMDINLSSDKTGIDAAKLIYSNFNIPVVFVTAFGDPETVSKAMQALPFGYVLKPFKDADIATAITIALQQREILIKQKVSLDYHLQQQTGAPAAVADSSLFVKHKGQLEKVMTSHIIFLEAIDNYTAIHTAEQKYLVSSVLKSLHAQLPANRFIRTHKSYVVNTEAIKSIEENSIRLHNHATVIPIGKSYRSDFFDKLKILH